MSLPSRVRHKAPHKEGPSKSNIEDLFAESSHIAYISNNHVKCARCRSSFKKTDPSAVHFLRSPCSKIGHSCDKPTLLPYECFHVGHQVTHSTHKLKIFRGFVFCGRCGARSVSKSHKLARPCEPPTSYGKSILAALSEGRLPPNMTEWPNTD